MKTSGKQQEVGRDSNNLNGVTQVLVLSRKKDERIVIGGVIEIMIVEVRGDKVRIGIEAPKDITVHRKEIQDEIDKHRPE